MFRKILVKGTEMWFEICWAIALLLAGFVTMFLGVMGIPIVIDLFSTSPILSIISIFGAIGIITTGILMVSGAYRMSREIKEGNID